MEPIWPYFDKNEDGLISRMEFVDLALAVLEKGGKADQFDSEKIVQSMN